MVLHHVADPQPMVRAVLYPLWDANLKVGHAVRTVDESREAAQESLETLTSLLSARLVAGEAELFEQLIEAVAGLLAGRPLASRLVAEERERRLLDPYPIMSADLKNGRGALRTHQGFWWERRRAEILGLAVDEPGAEEVKARTVLLATRNALHATTGRAVDRFVVDLREPAARWLGTDVYTLADDLTAALDVGDRLADRHWPDLHSETDTMVPFKRRILGLIQGRFSAPDQDSDDEGGILTIAVRAAARAEGASFTREEEETIRGAAQTTWTEADRTAFVTLLSAGARGRTIFGRLEELGWVDRELPEWGPVATAPQLAPFHDHPVGAHLWRAAAEMHDLIEGGGETGAIADEVGSAEELLLAAFVHDIGKARGGDHAQVGAALVTGFMRRVGFGPATTGVIVEAVRLHLLLSETATRRDIADLGVIDEVAAQVGDRRQLQVLYLLTIADLRATGTTTWNQWRATLIRTLYTRVLVAIERGGAPPSTPNVEAILDVAHQGVSRRSIEEHVAAMPPNYLDTATPQDVLWHRTAAADLEGPVTLSRDPMDPGRVLAVGDDRSGFLLAVSQAFTANGVGIMEARLRTRADGIAIDTFHVCDDRTGEPIRPDRWGRVEQDLIASLSGRVDLQPVIRERVLAYRNPDRDSGPVQLRVDRAGHYASIEVRAPDRVGLLTDIVEALHGEGLDIHLARIDTVGGYARDVFFVRWVGGAPIIAESERAALGRRLEARLKG